MNRQITEYIRRIDEMTKHSDNSDVREEYDLVIIGAGLSGITAAKEAVKKSIKTALIEKNKIGGSYYNYGFIPFRTLGRESEKFRVIKDFNIKPDTDIYEKISEKIHKNIYESLFRNSYSSLKNNGIDLFSGSAYFSGENTVMVGKNEIKFKKAIIATGTTDFIPPVKGLEKYLTVKDIYTIENFPDKILILGAGPLGCQTAQIFSNLGVKVFLVEKEKNILNNFESKYSNYVRDELIKNNVSVYTGTEIIKIEKEKNIFLSNGKNYDVDEIIICCGKTPDIYDFLPDNAGIEYDIKKGIKIDEYLKTTNKNIYCAGDISSEIKNNANAVISAKVAFKNAFSVKKQKITDITIPFCIYTKPQIASVGITDKLKYNFTEYDLSENDKMLFEDINDGIIEIYTENGGKRILGVFTVADKAEEIADLFSVIIENKTEFDNFDNIVISYPSYINDIKDNKNFKKEKNTLKEKLFRINKK
ncbi:MAG: NAD(P)/FAD-dependent oxidoreductase [Thermotogae bacterium]|nr:NAD(P)/FAD-dependent oxidoreductase [Thermotogota bacterium]MCP5465089.1 NAD(P)/FAD-dependent oxidoreductase [Thermotogota bacterium]HOO74136.1 NAD(P)/FAD-dependent oxidoreductase [Tepiditoga sp.]